MSSNFNRSLAIGKRGEDALLLSWPGLEKLDGRRSDFRVTETGELLELKSDQYSMADTENFFIERWGNFDRKTNGGPWQAVDHGSTLWVYMYAKDRIAFIFHTPSLVAFLDEHLHLYEERQIKNTSWLTVGYKVPRSALKHLYTERDLNVTTK